MYQYLRSRFVKALRRIPRGKGLERFAQHLELAAHKLITPGYIFEDLGFSYYGPVDLVDAYLHPPHPDPLRIREVQDTLFGGTLDQMRDRYRGASPIEFATRPLPATLLVNAGRDHIVEPRYGRRMYERLMKTGTKAVYLEIPWADHAFDEVFNGPSNQLALYNTERFLAWALDSGNDSARR